MNTQANDIWPLRVVIDWRTVLSLKEASIRNGVPMKDYVNQFLKHGISQLPKEK